MDKPKHPDVQRIQRAMDQMVQYEKLGGPRGGWDALAEQHIDVPALNNFLVEVSVANVKQEPFDRTDEHTRRVRMAQCWMDGFMLGIEYRYEEALAEAFVGAPGKVSTQALMLKSHGNLSGWAERGGDALAEEWAKRVDTASLSYATSARVMTGIEAMDREETSDMPDGARNALDGAAMRADGWTIGYLFQKVGGHRE